MTGYLDRLRAGSAELNRKKSELKHGLQIIMGLVRFDAHQKGTEITLASDGGSIAWVFKTTERGETMIRFEDKDFDKCTVNPHCWYHDSNGDVSGLPEMISRAYEHFDLLYEGLKRSFPEAWERLEVLSQQAPKA